MYKVVAEELKKEEEDMVEPDVELSDREQIDKIFANKLHRNRWFSEVHLLSITKPILLYKKENLITPSKSSKSWRMVFL